jgi:hypothetical protein
MGASGMTGIGTTGANSRANQAGQLAQQVAGLLSQWASARAAKQEQQAADLERKVEQEAAQMEAASEAEDQWARERAAFLADPSGASVPAPSGNAEDQAALLRAQLYAQGQASTANAGDDSGSGGGTAGAAPTPAGTSSLNPAAAVGSSENQPETSTASTAADPSANPAFASIVPQNPGFAAAMQNSEDTPPPPAVLDTVQQETDVPNPSSSGIDKLEGLFSTVRAEVRTDVASVKATLSTLMNTPIGQMLSQGMPTTGPAPLASDTPEEMGSKSSGQAILGFGFFAIRPPWRAIDNYNTGNMNVVMPQLGYAAAMPDSGGQQ